LLQTVQTRRVHPSDLGTELPLLINSAAGSTSTSPDQLEEAFRSAGVSIAIHSVAPDDFPGRLRALVEQGAPAVGVGGGDGTISTAVDVLAGTRTILVPVPLGTLNHFATRYGLATIAAAAQALRTGHVLTIPIGRMGGRTFVNNASCGFYPHVVRYREKLRPFLSKWPAAFIAALLVMIRRPLLDIELTAAGSRLQRVTAAVWIGIGRHSLRLPTPGDATRSADVLEVVLPRPTTRLALLRLAWRTWQKLRSDQKAVDPELEIVRASEFHLAARHRIHIALDGEVDHLAGPLRFVHTPDALRVLSLIVPDAER
jgi:diacylglycerol kinase family enzyme